MGTLVQAPERADATVTGLQPIARPQERSVGSFLGSILEPVAQAAIKYQDDNAGKNIALGRNDKLNEVVREVSFLDRKNYKTGRTYQGIVNGQIALAQEFQAKVNNTDPAQFDPDELLREAREFTDLSVDNIHNADLPSAVKEQLYNAQLKENATYMSAVDKKIKRMAADTETTARVNATAELTRNLGTAEYTADEMVVNIGAFKDKRALAMQLANPDMSLEDINAAVSADVKSAILFNLDSIDRANGQPEDIQRLAYLTEASTLMLGEDIAAATQIQAKASSYRAEIMENNKAKAEYAIGNTLDDWETSPQNRTKEGTTALVSNLFAQAAQGSLPYEDAVRLGRQVLSKYTAEEVKILEAETVLDPMTSSITAYLAMGKSENDLITDVSQVILNQYPDNPAQGGLKLMQHFGNVQGEYSAGGIKRGSEIFFNSLLSYTNMSDSEVANDQFSADRQAAFNVATMMYNKYKSENPNKARDMLSGIDDKYIDAFSSVFETSGSLEDVRTRFKAPITTREIYASMDEAINNKEAIAKGLNLGSELLGGVDGVRSNSISDGLEPNFVDHVTQHLKGAKAAFSNTAGMSTPTSILARYQKAGGFVASPKGYSSVIHDVGVAKKVQNFKITGTSTPLGIQYMGKAYDAEKERLAKVFNVSASNIIASSDATGQLMNFFVYESKGWRGKGEPTLKETVSTPMPTLKKQAETFYQEDSTRRNSAAGLDDKYSNIKVGSAMVKDLNSGRALNVSVNSMYAQAFGGNRDVGTLWVTHMQNMEGFAGSGLRTKDANSKKPSFVYGHGMTTKTLSGSINMLSEVKAARGNPQAMMDVQGKFVRKYYSGVNKDLAAVGVPMPTTGIYPNNMLPSLLLVLDEKWHNGSIYNSKNPKRSLHAAMNARSYSEGLAILKRLNTFNRAKPNSRRNLFMINGLKSHYANRGR